MAITVTAAQSGAGTSNGIALAVKAVTGTAASPVGATATSATITTPELAITPTGTGSWVYGSLTNDFASGTFTADAASTFSLNTYFAGDSYCFGTFRSTSTTTSGTPVTVGASAPTGIAGRFHIALLEILQAAGKTLAEDASSPAVVSTTTATTVTTASFTPPAGSLLVAVVSSDNLGGSTQNMTLGVSDSSGLTWTQQVVSTFVSGSASQQVAAVFTAVVPGVALPVVQVNIQAYPFTLGSSSISGPPFLGSYIPATGNWVTATSPKTLALTANQGDVVLLFGGTEDISTTLGTPSDGSNGYTLMASQASTSKTCGGYAWATIVGAPPPLSVATPSLSNATLGVAYTQTLVANGGSGAGFTWAITAGALPSWASLNSATGVISGTPNATGTSNFTVRVTDSASSTAFKALSIAAGAASTVPLGPPGNWTLVFEDQFPGTSLNTNYWTAVSGAYGSSDPTQVSVSGGYCRLTANGMINSQPTLQGWAPSNPANGPTLAVGDCCEANINFPGPSGDANYNWPAWWASGGSWPANGEEDIFEGYNGIPSALNYHSASGANNGPFPSGSWCNSFHTYTLVRGAQSLDCYWDGVLVRSVTPNDSGGPQSLIVYIGGGNTYSPAETLVKYVRMWTPG